MSKTGRMCVVAAPALVLALATVLSGCASGSFSSSGSAPSGSGTSPANPNPPSLPKLTTPASTNDYVGTQLPGATAPENTVALHIDQTNSSYAYQDIAIAGVPNPVPNSSGLFDAWLNYRNLGDTSGVSGLGGPQYFGLAAEDPSRFAFFAYDSSEQLAALVPKQSSGCITPTAAATYQYVTLFGPDFTPATDAAWGTVQVSASGSGFSFANTAQYTQPSTTVGTAASTNLIPFATASCMQSSDSPGLGYFIDTPATAATGNTEVRAFLGPTGLLVANLQAADSSGNPLPLPGVLGMVQPSAAIDLSQVTGTAANPVSYQTFVYQPQSYPAVQYGYFSAYSSTMVGSVDSSVFTKNKTTGMMGGWESMTSFSSPFNPPMAGFAFGAQDANRPGLFPNASFVWQIVTGNTCPAGSTSLPNLYCSSPAVAMVGLHDGKYVVFVTGILMPDNNAPTLFVLAEE